MPIRQKKKWIIVGAFFFGIASVAAFTGWITRTRAIPANDPLLATRGDHLYYGDLPYSGIVVDNYLNGVKFHETEYRGGLKEGTRKEFALTGRLKALDHFAGGKREGVQLAWYEEGPRRYEYHYKNGFLDGVQTQWHMSGDEFRREVFVNGEVTDKKILFQNGTIFTNYAKRDGRVYGTDGGNLCMQAKREGEK